MRQNVALALAVTRTGTAPTIVALARRIGGRRLRCPGDRIEFHTGSSRYPTDRRGLAAAPRSGRASPVRAATCCRFYFRYHEVGCEYSGSDSSHQRRKTALTGYPARYRGCPIATERRSNRKHQQVAFDGGHPREKLFFRALFITAGGVVSTADISPRRHYSQAW